LNCVSFPVAGDFFALQDHDIEHRARFLDFDSCRHRRLPIVVAAMRSSSFILLFALVLSCGGCQSIGQSFERAASDYHRMTTGSESTYIAEQRSHS
jgi:hypothetical protein